MARNSVVFFQKPKVPQTHYLSNRIYTDPEIFEEEQRKIFAKVWRFVCHVSELPNLNDYRTTMVAGTPLIIIKGTDGEIRTFVNTCSHRSAAIVREPRGNAKMLECIFHRWCYDNTTGECTARPSEGGFDAAGPRIEDCGLRSVKTEIYHGLVFVNLDDKSMSLREYLGDGLEMHDEIIGTVALEVFDFWEYELNANWKCWQETNMDLYHEYMHSANRKTSLGEEEYYKRKWKVYANGHVGIDRYKVRYEKYKGWKNRYSISGLPGLDPAEFQLVDIFPDMAVNARGTVLRIDCQIPLAANKTIIQFRALGIKGEPEDVRRQRAKNYCEFWGPFGRNLPEDLMASELQELAMHGGQAPYSFYSREAEGKTHDDIGVRSWYQQWSRLMGRDAANP